MATDKRVPVSPIHGMISTVGDATHGPLVQLLNPVASGIFVVVYELKIGVTIAAGTSRIRVRRTNAPLTLAATVTTATPARKDERDLAAIVATLKGSTSTVLTAFTEANSFWFDAINKDTAAGYVEPEIFKPLSFPLIIAAGSALEDCNPDASATNSVRIYASWDELVNP